MRDLTKAEWTAITARLLGYRCEPDYDVSSDACHILSPNGLTVAIGSRKINLSYSAVHNHMRETYGVCYEKTQG